MVQLAIIIALVVVAVSIVGVTLWRTQSARRPSVPEEREVPVQVKKEVLVVDVVASDTGVLQSETVTAATSDLGVTHSETVTASTSDLGVTHSETVTAAVSHSQARVEVSAIRVRSKQQCIYITELQAIDSNNKPLRFTTKSHTQQKFAQAMRLLDGKHGLKGDDINQGPACSNGQQATFYLSSTIDAADIQSVRVYNAWSSARRKRGAGVTIEFLAPDNEVLRQFTVGVDKVYTFPFAG